MPYTDRIVLALLAVSLLGSLLVVGLGGRGWRGSDAPAPPDQNTLMLQDAAYG